MRLSLPMIALAVAAAACSGGGDSATSTAPPTSVAATTTTVDTTPPDLTSGWRRINVPETEDFAAVPLAVIETGSGVLAVGVDAQDRAAVWSSPDGTTWNRLPHNTGFDGAAIVDVVPGGPGHVAVGATASGGRFAASTEQAVVWTSSDDGQTWERVDSASFAGAGMTGIAVGGPGLVAAGTDGESVVIWTSADGLEWERAADPIGILEGATPNDIAAAGPGLAVVGVEADLDGAAWVSGDGSEWRRVPIGSGAFAGAPVWEVAQRDGRLVAVGQTLAEGGAAVWISEDGLVWDRVPLPAEFLGATMLGVDVGPAGFVAHGLDDQDNTALWFSVDGVTWERVPHDADLFGGFSFVRDVAYGRSGIVAVGDTTGGMTGWVWTP